ALVWGIGPALFAIVLGLIAIAGFLSPGIFTPDIGRDVVLGVPFVVMQIVGVVVVTRLEVARRGLLAAQQQARIYAQKLESTNQALVQANNDLEHANELKDYVITRASHELRTPMTTILGRTQLVLHRLSKAGETDDTVTMMRAHIEKIERQAQRLHALLDELFDLSSIHSGLFPLRLTTCDLRNLCCEVIEAQHTLSGRPIQGEIPPDPVLLQADEKRLYQVFANLVNNAVKYAPAQAMIHVRLKPEQTHVILQVHNEGPQVPQEQLALFFAPFYRDHIVEYSPIQGWGLGLTISKEIVERHGGKIRVESLAGIGTTFFVELPMPTITQTQITQLADS
ncbi:MAG TPA: HAMP domain-containing sensor histidine kinase, partial [Ktedonobacteraceae bacterium]|nr:HAMP domain-containing sensor histidine kinase [Ktedonobacteraceae bacterium]